MDLLASIKINKKYKITNLTKLFPLVKLASDGGQ